MTTQKSSSGPDVESRLQRIETSLFSASNLMRFDVYQFAASLWRGKWFIGAVTATFTLAFGLVAFWLPDEYKAESVLMPAVDPGSSSLSGLAGSLGGLASLAGINPRGDSASDRATMAKELVKSWDFLERFARDNNLQVALVAAQGWERKGNRLVIDPKVYDVGAGRWVRQFNSDLGESAEPSGWELFHEMEKRIDVTESKETGLITLSVKHYSPTIAKELVEKLVASVNRFLQERDKQEALKSIVFLEGQIARTNLSEMKNVFYGLIEEQTKTLMLAEASTEYALKTVSPPKVPEQRSAPRRALICTLGALLGLLTGVFVWVVVVQRRAQTR